MRRNALLVAAVIGLVCCALSVFGARTAAVPEGGEGGAPPPHHMRGWTEAKARLFFSEEKNQKTFASGAHG